MTNKRATAKNNSNSNSNCKSNDNSNGNGKNNSNGKNNLLSHHKSKGQATVVRLIPPHSDEAE